MTRHNQSVFIRAPYCTRLKMGIICSLLTVYTGRTFQSNSKRQRLLAETGSEEELVEQPVNSRQEQQLLFEDLFFFYVFLGFIGPSKVFYRCSTFMHRRNKRMPV